MEWSSVERRSANDAIKAHEIGHNKRVMLPLLIVIHETLGFHEPLEPTPVRKRGAGSIGRVGRGGKCVERRPHVERLADLRIDEGEIDGEPRLWRLRLAM